MKIQFNTDKTISGEESKEDYYNAMIAKELKRFQSHISRIEVHIKDENGNKEGLNDKFCTIEARLEGMRPIAVSDQAGSIEKAVSGAIEKLKTALDTILGKLQNR